MKKMIWENLTGAYITEAILARMAELFDDFPQARKACQNAMEKLAQTQGELCAALSDAIDGQLRALVLFSAGLGLKENLARFRDPVRDFLDVGFDVFLQEETAGSLPAIADARRTQAAFFARLSPAEQEIYDAVTEYICYLETVAPKLAHYHGYLLGNDLLPQMVPGYHPDAQQTFRYREMLTHWAQVPPTA